MRMKNTVELRFFSFFKSIKILRIIINITLATINACYERESNSIVISSDYYVNSSPYENT